MSDELVVSVSMKYQKGSVIEDMGQRVFASDVAGTAVSRGVLDLTATYEAVPLGDVGTIGMCLFTNRGNEDICVHSALTGGPTLRVKIGETQIWRPDTAGFSTIAAKAATGASTLEFAIFSE